MNWERSSRSSLESHPPGKWISPVEPAGSSCGEGAASVKIAHMGLQTVELIMAVEEAFAVEFSDAIAEKLSTVEDIHGTIVELLRTRGLNPDPAEVWEKLKPIVVEQLGVRPEEVFPSARIVEDLGAN